LITSKSNPSKYALSVARRVKPDVETCPYWIDHRVARDLEILRDRIMSGCIDSDPGRFSAAPDYVSIDNNALRMNKIELQVLNGIVGYLYIAARLSATAKGERISIRFAPGLWRAVNERIVFDPDTCHRV